MTDQHPITPPPELLQQWAVEYWGNPGETIGEGEKYIATQAVRWGADQELEACIDVILAHPGLEHPELLVEILRTARRPKPPSLKEQALEEVGVFEGMGACNIDIIRRALESMPD
jgi:hypothetical protein